MGEQMTFPKTWEEFEDFYGFKDHREIYTNGSRLIPSFRVKQWLEHLNDADSVNVVQCKDCKNWSMRTATNYGYCWLMSRYFKNDDYCSYSVRKE